ncbi:MAG: Rpn family recombination-promoting nuclease/putative transposase [Clostridia bacterium]|nr:Rpn family recombination-promoting nuclease/putative transposase [Clostridia bacterium]
MSKKSDDLNSIIPLSGPIPHGMTNDYMFRAVLQKNIIALKYLIASLLAIPVEMIQSVEILNTIILGEALDDKTCILDLHICLNNNKILNLEMQINNNNDWPERSLYYLSRAFSNLKKGQSYADVMPSIHIGILNFALFPDASSFYSEYLMQNTKTHQIYSDKFAIRVLDLTQIDTTEAKEECPELYYWAKLFVAKTWEEVHMLSEKSEGLQEAVLTLRELSEDEKIQLQCEARERYDHDRASAIRCGRLEGIREGKLEGLREGMLKGTRETQLATAKKMLQKGMSLEDILDITGLSKADLESMQ